MDELLHWRKEFPILDTTVYMISHSLGAMPRGVYSKLKEYADKWATRGVRAWAEGWWEMPQSVGDKVGRIMGADPGTVVMHQNVSICQSVIISCFDFKGKRNKIVYDDMNFPSVMYVYEAQKANGARVEMVKSDDGITVDLQKMLDAIDEETLLVPISHVLYKSAFLQDIKPIVDKAHSVGALVVLDVYQSAGTVPFSVKELDVDFAVGGSVKWLCGGPGAGFLYVRPDLITKFEPKATGWMAHEHPFDFDIGQIKYSDDIFRYLHGSPHIPALYSAVSGYDIINAIGVEKIRAKSKRQTSYLVQLAEDRGFRVTSPTDPERRGSTITIDVPHAPAVTKELIRREFIVDHRPEAGIRISPHYYTKDEELELTVDEIRHIIDTGAYKKHQVGDGPKF